MRARHLSLLEGTLLAASMLLLSGSAAAQRTPLVAADAPAGSEHYEAQGVGFAPWTFDLLIEGNAVTGTIGQGASDPQSGMTTSLTGPFPISDGRVEGNQIEFKAETSGTVVTFAGTIDGDEIQFRRSVNRTGGFTGIFGGNGATEFVASKGSTARSPAPAGLSPAPAVAVARPDVPVPLAGATVAVREIWRATDVPNGPWVLEFTLAGTAMIGTVRQNGAPAEPVTIAAGRANGLDRFFKILSPDGERVITFSGRIDGSEISFVRQIAALEGGTSGGNDLFGESAPLQFVANRVMVPAATSTSSTIELRGMTVDIGAMQTASNLQQMLDSLSRQIEIAEIAVQDPEQLAFLKSIPLVWRASAAPQSENAAYGRGTILLASQIYSPEKPVLLHELMHAYHDLRLPDGFANSDIQALYEQALASGQFPAGSYMLQARGEYFAMMASVYLHGSAARDPFTREAVREKQPDFYAWMESEFGPK
jgi:hypothetical protein